MIYKIPRLSIYDERTVYYQINTLLNIHKRQNKTHNQ